MLVQAPVIEDFAQVSEQGHEVISALSTAHIFMRSNFKSKGSERAGGWSQFIDETNKAPSISGTACGLITLIACGESKSSEIIHLAKQLLIERVREDGGWSISALHDECSQTRLTCLALRALVDVGESVGSDIFRRGIDWLLRAQNADGGWGEIAKDNLSDVTSTAYVLQVLVHVLGIVQESHQALSLGQAWLQRQQKDDYSWGKTIKENGTLAHTSHAVEALLACGVQRASLSSTRDWLLNAIQRDDQFIERYLVSLPNNSTHRLIWTHISKERALTALIKLGTQVTTPAISECVGKILARQNLSGSWITETFSDSAPSWAIMEAVTSLRLYLDILEREGSIVALRQEVSEVRMKLSEQDRRLSQIEKNMHEARLDFRLARIFHILLKPIPLLAIITVFLSLLYLLLRSQFNLPVIADAFVGILGILGFSLTLYQIIESVKQPSVR